MKKKVFLRDYTDFIGIANSYLVIQVCSNSEINLSKILNKKKKKMKKKSECWSFSSAKKKNNLKPNPIRFNVARKIERDYHWHATNYLTLGHSVIHALLIPWVSYTDHRLNIAEMNFVFLSPFHSLFPFSQRGPEVSISLVSCQ